MKRSQSKSVSWRKDNPSLEEVFNQVKKMQADGDDVVMLYEGAFSDPLDDNKTYHFPGAVDIYQILAFDDLMDVMLQSIEVSWWVQPIKPYTFEIVMAGQQPSLKEYEISESEWPDHIRKTGLQGVSW